MAGAFFAAETSALDDADLAAVVFFAGVLAAGAFVAAAFLVTGVVAAFLAGAFAATFFVAAGFFAAGFFVGAEVEASELAGLLRVGTGVLSWAGLRGTGDQPGFTG